MLPKLASLDTLLLADETKQLAEATFLKKQMYYNMRIKTMHRNARNIIKLATEGKKVRLATGTAVRFSPSVRSGRMRPGGGRNGGEGAAHVRAAASSWRSLPAQVRSQYNRPAIARLVQHQKELQRELGEAHAYGQDMPAPGTHTTSA